MATDVTHDPCLSQGALLSVCIIIKFLSELKHLMYRFLLTFY